MTISDVLDSTIRWVLAFVLAIPLALAVSFGLLMIWLET